MQTNNPFKFKVFSLNVLGIRDQTKRRSIFTFLKDQNATIYFFARNIPNQVMKIFGKKNGKASYSSHMAQIIAKVFVS